MYSSREFLVGLLDQEEPPDVACEDFDGKYGSALQRWREMGFLSAEPGMHPAPSCPHCGEGVPYRLGQRYLCNRCHVTVDSRQLLLWRLNLEPFLRWLTSQLQLRGELQMIDDRLWQLGTWASADSVGECFYRRTGFLSDAGRRRLSAYRHALVLYAASAPSERETPGVPSVSLLELLRPGEDLTVVGLGQVLREDGAVRFESQSGTLQVGGVAIGDVPLGSREFFFLECLARDVDRFVSYADLKHFVLQKAGSNDATEEATFCQNLKSRIKKKWVPGIDRLITTTNKGDGYRMRGRAMTTIDANLDLSCDV